MQQQAMYNNPQYAMQVMDNLSSLLAKKSPKPSDAAVLRKYGAAVSWRSPRSSSPNVPGTTWGGTICRVNSETVQKEQEMKCKCGISVCDKVEVRRFLISEQAPREDQDGFGRPGRLC